MTTPERAKDLAQPGAIIRGIAQGSTDDQEQMTSFYRKQIARLPEMELVAKQVYEMSGLGPNDVDAAVIYDAFSSIILFQLESFGFCDFGEAKDFIQDGALEVGGRFAQQHSRGAALRGLHPWHQRRKRGRATGSRHLGESAGKERLCTRHRRSGGSDERHDSRKARLSIPRKGVGYV